MLPARSEQWEDWVSRRGVYVVVNFYFQLKFSFPALFLYIHCTVMYVQKQRKTKY